jgi:hypothetical protein
MVAESYEVKTTPVGVRTRTAPSCAPLPVANVAASLARDLFYEKMRYLRPPTDHKIVPEVTVSISYRFESTKEK